MLELTVRLVASLAVVVGLLLVLARFAGRRFAGRPGAPIQVLHRQSLSRSSAVAMIAVGSRVLLVGSTDQQVSLLTELDPDEIDLPEPLALQDDERVDLPEVAIPSGPLAGSLLSTGTWKAAFAAATGKKS